MFKLKIPAGEVRPRRQEAEAGLGAFASETEPAAQTLEADSPESVRRRDPRTLVIAVLILSLVGTAAAAGWKYRDRLLASANDAAPVAGAAALAPAPVHPPAPASSNAAPSQARLSIETEPAALPVMVDGVDRGASPVVVTGLAPGAHDVAVRTASGLLRRTIALRPAESTVVIFAASGPARPESVAAPAPAAPVAAPAASGGWLAVVTSFPVQIREAGKVIGTTEADRLMLPAGTHALEFSNEALGYQGRRTVKVEAGKTTSVQLEKVMGVLSVNAMPWAEVWIDGERVGQTPIGNLSRPIGTYDVVLRHPDLGERRERVTITARHPARLGVDLRKK